MAQAQFLKDQARQFLDARLRAAGAQWIAKRHAAAPGHPAARRVMYRRIDAALAVQVSKALHVYLEDLDFDDVPREGGDE